ncbi:MULTISPECIES: hypothetical protein [unclassified Streptomyces]|uniref:hypothetical protein n=1 Tax=unclassified Streptomyces TaxID=2593676 RepID=UPI00088E23B6|nr:MULTISPECIES: hypothetical protein [unclassified Streptomyces]PBC83499.1 hypothetical protein BX261_3448 [Streptomyces sp. 2321.6]SDR41760.1 hypothetical protein SAMN05216511_3753 [Streptomyces sp. KS_16]SEC98655.1 hypothetical protein SAMN05428940_3449 [Streptomyces sp. 2133.1]SNC69577.1 hypothetical protein SAMN06272741_3441 [Streptomyces sp. 2114.4]
MGPEDTVRLLPWLSPDGKPCFLAGDGTGYVSRLADEMEDAQLDEAAELIEEACRVLAAQMWTPGELHLLAVELTAALTRVHRVAESRGARVPARDDGDPGRTALRMTVVADSFRRCRRRCSDDPGA